jgi:hypothetical protein
MILNNLSLMEDFKEFNLTTNTKDMDKIIEYYSIFGGLDVKIDANEPLDELIKTYILDDYSYLRQDVSRVTTGNNHFNRILTGASTGDRRINSTFKKANISYENGMNCIDELCQLDVISLESSFQHLTNKKDTKKSAKKIIFKTQILRFWFAFVSPIFQNIKSGDYDEFQERFESRFEQFTEYTFYQLTCEFLKVSFKDDEIVQIGGYWDTDTTIDIIAKTKSGKIIAGTSKYTNSKIKKSELNKLKENCEKLGIKADVFVIFSKKGFSSELKSLKSESIKLYTSRNFSILL